MNDIPLQIAIDGPVASGKGDIASRISKKFGMMYVYTGAMYRALALLCIRERVSFHNESAIMKILNSHAIEMTNPHVGSSYPYAVILDGEDITERITHQDTAQGASDVGIHGQVRAWMVDKQKKIAAGKRIVMEGRDIGLRVLPHADLKIYLTASVEERTKRRYRDWTQKGIDITLQKTLEDTKKRDLQDMMRTSDPLQKVPDVWELDTTDMTQDQVVAAITNELTKRNLV